MRVRGRNYTSRVKIVFWQIEARSSGGFQVKFWTNQTNALVITMVDLTEEKMRNRIEAITGLKRFVLEQVTQSGRTSESNSGD